MFNDKRTTTVSQHVTVIIIVQRKKMLIRPDGILYKYINVLRGTIIKKYIYANMCVCTSIAIKDLVSGRNIYYIYYGMVKH